MDINYYKEKERKTPHQRESKRHTRPIFFLRTKSTRKQISRRTVSLGGEETCVIHDLITDLRVVPETSLIVT